MDTKSEAKFFKSRTKDIQNVKGVLFENMGLKPELLAGIRSKKFYLPSPIQEDCIPRILEHKNVLARSKSGTGKTASYLIPLIHKVDPSVAQTQSIVVVPTRELAFQTCAILKELAKFTSVTSFVLTGGKRVSDDVKSLNKGMNIVVSTLGRLNQFVEKNLFSLESLRVLCFDEADSIIQSDISQIMDRIVSERPQLQLLLFSATFPKSVAAFKTRYMGEAVEVNTMREFTLKGVSQFYAYVEEKDKVACLYGIVSKLKYDLCIVFCNSVNRVILLDGKLRELGFACGAIHSKMDNQGRLAAFDAFKTKRFRILVCSDIFYRGIDIESVNVVINFDLPTISVTYLHRIGRSGRFGQYGLGISFVSDHDKEEYLRICRELRTTMNPIPLDVNIDEALYVSPV